MTVIRGFGTINALAILVLLPFASVAVSQTEGAKGQSDPQVNFNVSVDEVSLTFHAANAQGLPITNLKLNDLTIYDNLKHPRKVLVFEALPEMPVRAGILLDTSQSMDQSIPREKVVSTEYIQQFVRPRTDLVFSETFGYTARVTQPWTGDPAALEAGIAATAPSGGETALFAQLYCACEYQFGESASRPGSGRFILVFTDGDDNASHVELRDVVDACHRANAAIYAFRPDPTDSNSSGPKNLVLLTSETGGRVFLMSDSASHIHDDLQIIDSDLRNRYWLVYRPSELRHDGQFHQIYVGTSESADDITIDIRSGYYAPVR